MKKRFFLAAMTLLVSMGASAQGNGIGGITEATNMVTSYFDPGTKLIYAIGAVIGLIGGVKVYSKFSAAVKLRDVSNICRQLVRCVYLPDCRCHHLTLILPVIWRNSMSTRGLGAARSSRDSRASTCSSLREDCSRCS